MNITTYLKPMWFGVFIFLCHFLIVAPLSAATRGECQGMFVAMKKAQRKTVAAFEELAKRKNDLKKAREQIQYSEDSLLEGIKSGDRGIGSLKKRVLKARRDGRQAEASEKEFFQKFQILELQWKNKFKEFSISCAKQR